MSIMKPHLYINSKGYFVTRHSYSGSDSFNFCAKKYQLERIQGWGERDQRSSSVFGTILEKAITFWHQHRFDTPGALALFNRLWEEHKDKKYSYSKADLDWNRLSLTGQELVRLYAIRYPTFPYIVNNPSDFQVETNMEVFPGTKLAGLEFTSYIDLIAQLKNGFAPIIIDIKTSGKAVPEFAVLDPQLRSYSWVKSESGGLSEGETPHYLKPWPNAGFLWFHKCGRNISKGDTVTFLEDYAGYHPGDDVTVVSHDVFGLWVTQSEDLIKEYDEKFVGESKAVKSARGGWLDTNTKHVPERCITKQKIEFKHVVIPEESAMEIGRSIKRDMINIVKATETDFFPMQGGVRYPNDKCTNCPMRGICANRPELRDLLLVRKNLEELDFSVDSE
jgi:hypothetical protein